MGQSLANGQLGTSAGTLLAGSSSIGAVDAIFQNTSGSTTETVLITLLTAAGNTRRIARAVLAPNEQLTIQGLPLGSTDTLQGQTTDATTVDYVISQGGGALEIRALDATGATKQNTTSLTGNETVAGRLTAQLLAEGPAPTDTFGATMTINVANSLHVIAASNTTSATPALTPSAGGTAGDKLTILTECDGTGTVTTTFSSPFHSSGTQATGANKNSTVQFESDGVKWLETARVTNLA